MSHRHLRWSTICVTASLVALAGCSKKTPECNSLVEVINAVGAAAKPETSPDPKAHAATLKSAAEVDDKAGADIAKLTLSLPELQKSAKDLQSGFRAHAAAARELSTHLAKLPDAAAAKALETKIDKARDLLEASERDLETACEEKEDACTSVAPLLKDQPEASGIDGSDLAKTKAWQASVDKWAGELGKAEVKEEAVKKAVGNIRSAIKDLASGLVELAAMNVDEPKREAAGKAAEKAGMAIGAAIDELNKFCQAP